MFLEEAFQVPTGNFFATVEKKSEEDLQQMFAEDVQLTRSRLISNSNLLRKHLNKEISNLKGVALGERPAEENGKKGSEEQTLKELEQQKAFIFDATNFINENQLAHFVATERLRPMVVEKLGGFTSKVEFVQEPKKPNPSFVVIEEYTTCSYLGDYGAGRTIKTFSLLPGEKTTITVRTYKDISSTKSYSENVLDSFSESSTNELEKFIEEESGYSDTKTSENSEYSSKTKGFNVGASVSGAIKDITIGASIGFNSNSSKSSSNSTTATRSSNVRSVNKALDKHVATSNANRSIEVNTSTTESVTEGEETCTVREIENINKSRVLNFVFRQLLQEYITITYLSNIKIAFCNGYEESLRIVDIDELDSLLENTVQEGCIEDARTLILKNYCTIYNYKGIEKPFIEQITRTIGECFGLNETEKFWRIIKDEKIKDTHEESGIEVNGPILYATTHTLKTSSTVVDALLGQGEALDCFNMKAQDAVAMGEQLKNIEHLQQMTVIQGVTDLEKRAELYKKVFGDCCCGDSCCCCPKCIVLKDKTSGV